MTTEPAAAYELVVELDGFEGPIAMLLALAREQKVDLKQISILALAEQYLAFIAEAHRLHLELAGDYLVMAAWLAYLKSRLLLPDPPPDDEPSGAELAAALQFRLQRLAAMQEAGARLFDRPLLGREVFARGAPEGFTVTARPRFEVSLYELMRAYAGLHRANEAAVLEIPPTTYHSVDDALKRLALMLGGGVDWRRLQAFLPLGLDPAARRSALAATFVAGLELARGGRAELRQEVPFGPIWLRAMRGGAA